MRKRRTAVKGNIGISKEDGKWVFDFAHYFDSSGREIRQVDGGWDNRTNKHTGTEAGETTYRFKLDKNNNWTEREKFYADRVGGQPVSQEICGRTIFYDGK